MKKEVKYINMPLDFRGATVRTVEPDGDFYTICINQNLSPEQQRKTYKHEEEHINNDDFSYVADVSLLERYRHGK